MTASQPPKPTTCALVVQKGPEEDIEWITGGASNSVQSWRTERDVGSIHYQLLHKSNAVKISVAITVSTKEAILPVFSANIGNSSNGLFKCGHVLLDSVAQISLIRQETAETLGLKGKDVSVTIAKVGGAYYT